MPGFDTKLFFALNSVVGRFPFLDWTIVFFAEYLAYVLVTLFLVWLIFGKRSQIEKIRVALSAIIATLVARAFIVELIRFFYHHPRPFAALSGARQLFTETGYSFPSGHAAFFFALSAVSYRYNRKLGLVFFMLSAIMGLARVAAGVHYPLDILGGAILGVCIGFVSLLIVDRFLLKKRM